LTLWQSTTQRTDALRCDLEHSKAQTRTHHRGMGKPLGSHSMVPQDRRLVHHPDFYYGLSRAVHDHIDAKVGVFSSQGRDDELFRLEPMRSTTFKVWLSSELKWKLSLCHLPLLFHIMFEWNNRWLPLKRRLSPLPIVIMDLVERLLLHN
jgi:hypothetical protein